MNKSELIDAIAQESGLSKTDAKSALEATTNSIGKALKKGESVTIIGFGTFLVRKRAARTARNPATGATIDLKASKSPVFKAGQALKSLVK